MARIFVSFIALGNQADTQIPCFYESFLNALADQGHEVVYALSNHFISNPWRTNKVDWPFDQPQMRRTIREFNPDLIICTNNSIPEPFREATSCPIAYWTADAPVFAPELNLLRHNHERITFFSISDDFDKALQKRAGVNLRRIHRLHFASDIQASPLNQDKNISFVGTNWQVIAGFRKPLLKLMEDPEMPQYFRRMIAYVVTHPGATVKELMRAVGIPPGKERLLTAIPHTQLLNMLASNQRLQILGALSDLGLHIYGPVDWLNCASFSMPLALSYCPQPVYSQQHTEELYNSSIICPNISHAQAAGTFGWRVRDVMASNAVLISTPSGNFKKTFGKTVKIPTFESPAEARELCAKLLKDKPWRDDIVASSQAIIEAGHRFRHRLKDIGEATGIPLVRTDETTFNVGSLRRLEAHHFHHPVKYPTFQATEAAIEGSVAFMALHGIKLVQKMGISSTRIYELLRQMYERSL